MQLRPLHATEVLLLLNSLLMRVKLDELLIFPSCHVVEFLRSLVGGGFRSQVAHSSMFVSLI